MPQVRIVDPLAAQLTILYLVNFYSHVLVAIPKTPAARQLKCALRIVLYMIYLFLGSPIHRGFSGCFGMVIHRTGGYRTPGWEGKAGESCPSQPSLAAEPPGCVRNGAGVCVCVCL